MFGAVVFTMVAIPASAQIDLPPLPQLPLPTPSDVPLSETVDDVTGVLTEVPEQLGGILGTPSDTPRPRPAPSAGSLRTDSWAIERSPEPVMDDTTRATVSSTSNRRPVSYGSALSGGFRAAAGRAAALAGPVAAPAALALLAVTLLVIAARGPNRLVKIEEERQDLRERRIYKL
jgi:hypothetical protein